MNTLLDKLRGVIQREVAGLNINIIEFIQQERPEEIILKFFEEVSNKTDTVNFKFEFHINGNLKFQIKLDYGNYSFNITDWINNNGTKLKSKHKAFMYTLIAFIEEEIERFENER